MTFDKVWKKRATFWFYVKLITAKPKTASYLLHWSNYTDVFKTLDSQENKNKILEIAMHIKQQISSKPLCLLKQRQDLHNFKTGGKTEKHDL